MSIICFFFPAFISLYIDSSINTLNNENKYLRVVFKYFIYSFLNATIMNTIIYLVSSEKYRAYSNSIFTHDFTLKYSYLALVIAIVLPFIMKIITSTIKINIEIKDKKNDKKNN